VQQRVRAVAIAPVSIVSAAAETGRRLPSDLLARVAVAVPAAAVLVALVHVGEVWFPIALALLGVFAQVELVRMERVAGIAALPGFLAVALAPLVAFWGGRPGLVGVIVAVVPLTFVFCVGLGQQKRVTATVSVTALGVAWIGFGLAHGVLLRELPHGAGLVIDVLLAVFLGDTAAHLFGSAFGRHKLAPSISPNKTVEGLVAGVVVGTASCVLAAVLFQDWLPATDALLIGLACALAGPTGDLFESRLKRDAGVKDSGRLFGAHGGVLDRIDAAVVAAVAGYYVALALGV
jgi:phosphatidate cytidylyltransferase